MTEQVKRYTFNPYVGEVLESPIGVWMSFDDYARDTTALQKQLSERDARIAELEQQLSRQQKHAEHIIECEAKAVSSAWAAAQRAEKAEADFGRACRQLEQEHERRGSLQCLVLAAEDRAAAAESENKRLREACEQAAILLEAEAEAFDDGILDESARICRAALAASKEPRPARDVIKDLGITADEVACQERFDWETGKP